MDIVRHLRTTGIVSAALGLTLLAGCSSSTTTGESASSSAAASESATAASESASGAATASMTGPIMVEPGTATVAATVGQFLNFNVEDPQNWKIETDNPDVLKISQGGKDGDAIMNPGAEAIAAGSAKVLLTNTSDQSAWEVAVTVTEKS